MFREEDYLNGEEPYASVEAPKNGCRWAGCLYERKTGVVINFWDHWSEPMARFRQKYNKSADQRVFGGHMAGKGRVFLYKQKGFPGWNLVTYRRN